MRIERNGKYYRAREGSWSLYLGTAEYIIEAVKEKRARDWISTDR